VIALNGYSKELEAQNKSMEELNFRGSAADCDETRKETIVADGVM
jgi:hypothetical protein